MSHLQNNDPGRAGSICYTESLSETLVVLDRVGFQTERGD
jgi:hypothetical protein